MDKLTNKQIILVVALLCIIFILFSAILKNLGKEKIGINYKNVDSQILLKASVELSDRVKYWNLNDIIMKILDAYEDEEYKKYYDILNDEYKRKLSNSKYNEKINILYDKLKVYPDEDEEYIDKDNVIEGIYQYINGRNMYVCKLKNDSYIGIQLDENENKYNIFYIE